MKNRTIVSRDCEECVGLLRELIPLKVHRYPSGSEYGTWKIPDEWNVIKGELTDGERTVVALKMAEGKRLMYRQPVNR